MQLNYSDAALGRRYCDRLEAIAGPEGPNSAMTGPPSGTSEDVKVHIIWWGDSGAVEATAHIVDNPPDRIACAICAASP
jgi:hypothetical protein